MNPANDYLRQAITGAANPATAPTLDPLGGVKSLEVSGVERGAIACVRPRNSEYFFSPAAFLITVAGFADQSPPVRQNHPRNSEGGGMAGELRGSHETSC